MLKVITSDMTKQMNREFAQLEAGRSKQIDNLVSGYYRSVDSGQMDMVLGQQKMFEMYKDINTFTQDFVKAELNKKKKSTFYKSFYAPVCLKFEAYEEGAYSKGKFTHPEQSLSYLIVCELNKSAVKHIQLTNMCKDIGDKFKQSYNLFEDTTSEELIGIIQLVRSYLIVSKYFKESSSIYNKDSTLFVEINNPEIEHNIYDVVDTMSSDFSYKPMLCEPNPHKDLVSDEGGYLTIKSPLLKRKDFNLFKEIGYRDEDFFKVVNGFQNTKWQVNVPFLNWLKESDLEVMEPIVVGNIEQMQKEFNEYNVVNRKLCAKLTDMLFNARKARKETVEEDEKNKYLAECIAIEKEIKLIDKLVAEKASYIGKCRGWKATLEDAEEYGQYDYFFHPVFIDQRSRFYTYNTNLSFQGSNFSKSIIQTYNKERLTEQGLEDIKILFGGMIEGYSKKKNHIRLAKVNEVIEQTQYFKNIIVDKDYSILADIDGDEMFTAINIMFELYHHYHNSEYKTGILGYIDATSSAIQIQALIQKCKVSASLTNLITSDNDELPDAYKSVANVCQSLCEELSKQTNTDLIVELSAYFMANYPDRYQRIAVVQG